MKYIILSACFAMFIGASCRKNKTKTELEKLPPITQTGANTFGCIINGKAFTPRGNDGKPNFYVIADPSYGGNLDIRAYRIINGNEEALSFGCFGITATGNFQILPSGKISPLYAQNINVSTCYFISNPTNFKTGFINITKYDLQNGIVSGEFECTLYDSTINCDTIKITNGRFDYNL